MNLNFDYSTVAIIVNIKLKINEKYLFNIPYI